ncbi:unnamed protein product, partial [Thlaspi arvense]
MGSFSERGPSSFADVVNFFEFQKPQVRNAVSPLIFESFESTQLARYVLNMFCTSMMEVADEFGVPTCAFLTPGARLHGLMFDLYTLQEDFGTQQHPAVRVSCRTALWMELKTRELVVRSASRNVAVICRAANECVPVAEGIWVAANECVPVAEGI